MTLEEVALTSDWLIFGRHLSSAMERAPEYGFEKPEHLLIEVAKLRGQSRSGVRTILMATRFVDAQFERMPSEGDGLPLAGIARLSRAKGTPEEIATALQHLLTGMLTVRQLESRVKEMNEKSALDDEQVTSSHGREAGRRRAKEFESKLKVHLSLNIDAYFGQSASLSEGSPLDSVPLDFYVTQGKSRIIGFLTKGPREMRHPRVLLEMLGLSMFALTICAEVWVITSPDWRPQLEHVARIAPSLGVRSVRLLVFTSNSDKPALEEIAALATEARQAHREVG